MKPIIMGQAPARIMRSHKAFDGLSGQRLIKFMGLPTIMHLHHLFDCRNLMDKYPGRANVGDMFPQHEASLAARLQARDLLGRVVVILGRGVAESFDLGWTPWLTWVCVRGAKVSVVPHPSGVNRWWNDETNLRNGRSFLTQFAKQVAAGEVDRWMTLG